MLFSYLFLSIHHFSIEKYLVKVRELVWFWFFAKYMVDGVIGGVKYSNFCVSGYWRTPPSTFSIREAVVSPDPCARPKFRDRNSGFQGLGWVGGWGDRGDGGSPPLRQPHHLRGALRHRCCIVRRQYSMGGLEVSGSREEVVMRRVRLRIGWIAHWDSPRLRHCSFSRI